MMHELRFQSMESKTNEKIYLRSRRKYRLVSDEGDSARLREKERFRGGKGGKRHNARKVGEGRKLFSLLFTRIRNVKSCLSSQKVLFSYHFNVIMNEWAGERRIDFSIVSTSLCVIYKLGT